MHICPCSFMQKYWDSDVFWLESVGIFRHLAFWHHRFKFATFFIARKNCIFWGASFKLIQNLAASNPEKLQDFHGTPLSHCYTLLINSGHGVPDLPLQEEGRKDKRTQEWLSENIHMKINKVVVMWLDADEISHPALPPDVSPWKGILSCYSFHFLGPPHHSRARACAGEGTV